MKIIEEKIKGFQSELADLKGEFSAFHQNKSCVADWSILQIRDAIKSRSAKTLGANQDSM